MATNHYFQGGNGIGNSNEKRLYEDLIIEGLKIYGHDCYYLPRTLVNRDLILGEDTLSRFDDSYLLEMYMETTEGFAGEQEVINKFGLDIREDTTFCISKRRWQNQVDSAHTMIVEGRPNEGDIIYFPLMDSFFEIQFVKDQEPFFQLGQLPVYKLRCKQYEYSQEIIDTGIAEIDAIEDNLSTDTTEHQFTLEQSSTQNEGISIQHSVGNFGLLLEETDGDNITSEDDDSSVGTNILLENAADTGNDAYLIQEDYIVGDMSTDKTAQNELFDSLDDDILDFSESNPFGDAGGT